MESLIWAIFALIVIVMFKKPLYELLSNFSQKGKVQYKGLNIDLGSGTNVSANQQILADAKYLELQKAYQSRIITNEEEVIKNTLIEKNLTPVEAVNVLIYHLAHANLEIKLLNIDKSIYEEQKKLLLYLNAQLVCSECDLLPFYEAWRQKSLNKDYLFKSFLNYLSQNQLVSQGINGYIIAPLGIEYLQFLVRIGNSLLSDIPSDKNINVTSKENNNEEK